MAEGADRIVAAQGLAHGASLEIVLPSPRADYETDFESEASKRAFRDLLKSADAVFELASPPGRLGEKRGYEAAGLVMLAHADVLITIWDEDEAAGIGGTGAIVERAVNEGAPVLLINPAAPDKVRLLWTGDVLMPPAMTRIEALPVRDGFEALQKVVTTLVAPPSDAKARDLNFQRRFGGADRAEPARPMTASTVALPASATSQPRTRSAPAFGWRRWRRSGRPSRTRRARRAIRGLP